MNVPTLNLDSEALDSDTLAKHLAKLQEEVLVRTRLVCNDNYGVVADKDPRILQAQSNPLWVEIANQYSCSITKGYGVTKSGIVVKLDADATIDLTSLSEGAANVIFLHAEIVDDENYVLASTGKQASTGTHLEVNLKCMDLNSFLAQSSSVRNDCLALAIVEYFQAGNKLTLTNSNYVWLRPWFSAVDREHRSKVGTGDVTPTNVHGVGVNDLVMRGVRLYGQLTSTGMVLSKDSSISGIPGYLCVDDYSISEVKIDTTGQVTKRSFFGGIGVRYVVLKNYPNMICSVKETDSSYEYPVDLIPNTKIMVFCTARELSNFTVRYVRTPSLSISSETASSVSFDQVTNRELVISSEFEISSVKNTSVFVRRYAKIPVDLRMMVDSSGEIVLDPKVVVPSRRPVDIPNNVINVNQSFFTPSYVGVGASKLGFASDLLVAVKLKGLDNQDNQVEEIIELDNESWEDTYDVVGTSEKYKQILYTKTSWNFLQSVEVLNTSIYPLQSCDPSGYIQIYAKLDPARHKNAYVATAFWNGREIKQLEDARRILPTIRDGIYGQTPITSIGELISGVNEIFTSQSLATRKVQLILSEDFQQPKYLNAPSVVWYGRELLDVTPVPKSVVDSSQYLNVYRSRVIAIRKQSHENLGIVVVLHNVDVTKINDGSVRVVLSDENTIVEAPLKLFVNDFSKRTFIAYFNRNWKAVSFVVSGRCQGFSAYFINSETIDQTYLVTPSLIWSE